MPHGRRPALRKRKQSGSRCPFETILYHICFLFKIPFPKNTFILPKRNRWDQLLPANSIGSLYDWLLRHFFRTLPEQLSLQFLSSIPRSPLPCPCGEISGIPARAEESCRAHRSSPCRPVHSRNPCHNPFRRTLLFRNLCHSPFRRALLFRNPFFQSFSRGRLPCGIHCLRMQHSCSRHFPILRSSQAATAK